jgi:molecular chaperone DnaK (HSP70)
MNVGIDLGTTNSALAFIDPREAEDSAFPPIRIQPIPQYVAPGLQEARKTLPSFLLLSDQTYIGAYARDQGALEPTRLVHSAKSWLSNPDVDRTAKILPWESQESGRVLSPVEVSGRFLSHMRRAWEESHSQPLPEQDIVLTVPASFDEEARELTVMAAREAGIEKLTLLEEPAAAFYSWIANHLAQSRQSLFDGQMVLVVDVGGGTSDFTLIRVSRSGDLVDFTRTAVGRHLLLGGDNLDLTLAWLVETKLGKQFSLRQRSSIRRQCTAAKEKLLSDPDLAKVEITVLGAGAAVVGGALKTEILREEALELTLEGFLPFCSVQDRPKEERRTLFRELGLPYVSDPAITRHLAAFLSGVPEFPGPDAILFNGGFFIPEICRQRLAEVIGSWYGRRPAILENRDLDLAVAVGAAYYSYARAAGKGVLVRGGLPRSYYIGIGAAAGEKPPEGRSIRTVCLAPRGTEEGTALELDRQDLQLLANRPVTFRLYSSLTRSGDALGEVVEFPPEDLAGGLHVHAPLHAVIRFGKRGERLVPVRLGARLTEVGTLDIWCDSKVSDHRWRLAFQLRKQEPREAAAQRAATVISEEALERAADVLKGALSHEPAPVPPEELPGRLEQALGLGKNSWPLPAIRRLADILLEHAEARKRSGAWEARWLNLCGFCLRPGFGYPGDDFRLEQARRVYAGGLQFSNQVQCEIEWWIFWGRVAGGLNRNQQVDLYQRLAGTLVPPGKKKHRVNSSLLREMWRTASSLELLPTRTRTELGDALVKRLPASDFLESDLWCLSRLGARELFYGPANQVVPPAAAGRWVEALLPSPKAGEAIAAIARRTGDPVRDLAPGLLETVRKNLEQRPEAERLLAIFEGEEARDSLLLSRIFGEELPSGLVFGDTAAAE